MNDKDLITPPGGPRRRSSVQGVRASEVVRRTPDGRYVIERDSASTHTAADTPDVSNVVITPGGVRARSLVHQIRPGAALDGTGGRHRMLSRSGEVLADFGMIHPRPGGKPLMPENVVHPTPDALDGWITYAYWDRPGTPISWLSTTWVAPPQPATQTGQLIYLFNGIQNSTMIYQPVLQWGSNGLFGGNYWCVATWYADGQKGAAFHSPPVTVSVGDILTGVITLTDQSAIGFNYSGFFQDIANSGFDLVNVPELLQAVQTLECYRITKCSNYPNTDKTAMSDINIQTGTTPANVMWTAKDKVTDCGQHTSILSELGQVDLWYRAAGVLSGLTLFADTVRGGGSVQGQVTLELPVLTDTPVSVVALDPGGGFSGPSDAVSLDPLDGVVNVLQGRTMRQFTINANKVAQTKQVVIVASAGVTKKAHLTVERSA